MAQITLYKSSVCPYAARVQIALREAGAKFQEYEIDLGNKPEWYQPKVNPASKVPAIALGGPDVPPDQPSPESLKLRESLPLIEWVAELYPDSTLLPKDPIARYRIRLFIEIVSSTLVPAFYAFVTREGNPEPLIKALETIQQLLPGDTKYAVSNDFTNADVAAAPFIGRIHLALKNDLGVFKPGEGKRMYNLLQDDPKFQVLWKYFEAVIERPSVKDTHPEELLLARAISRFEKARKAKWNLE